jgi:hypothetical protein
MAFEIPDGWIRGRAAYEVTPTEGGSRVSCRMEFRALGAGRLLEPVLARLLSHDSRRDDQRLKTVLESRSRPWPSTGHPEQRCTTGAD